jgi:RNA polymerase sigma-70 factor (ECF subfamily)
MMSTPEKSKHFEKMFVVYFPKIYNYVYFRVRDVDTAEDLTADVFLRAYRYYDSFSEEKSSIYTWLCAIARNLLNDYYTKTKRLPVSVLLDETISASDDIEADVERNELLRRLAILTGRLDEKKRNILAMKYMLDMSHREIARELNMTENALGVALHRIIAGLRKELEKFR